MVLWVIALKIFNISTFLRRIKINSIINSEHTLNYMFFYMMYYYSYNVKPFHWRFEAKDYIELPLI